jgi:hypothetical protein
MVVKKELDSFWRKQIKEFPQIYMGETTFEEYQKHLINNAEAYEKYLAEKLGKNFEVEEIALSTTQDDRSGNHMKIMVFGRGIVSASRLLELDEQASVCDCRNMLTIFLKAPLKLTGGLS